MSDAHCPHCGAERTNALTCPVCELKYDEHAEPPAPTPMGRAWQSGRLALGASVALMAAALVVPFATMSSSLIANSPSIPVTLLDMGLQSGPLAREIKSFTVLAVPFSAALMAQFLFTRTTGRAMRASRPAIFMLALLPLFSMVTGFLRLKRGGRWEVHMSVAPALVAFAFAFGMLAALRFGNGVPEKKPKRLSRLNEPRSDEHDER
jgi:hypothetical protein